MEKRFNSFDPKKVSDLIFDFAKKHKITEIEIVLVTLDKGEIKEEKQIVSLAKIQ